MHSAQRRQQLQQRAPPQSVHCLLHKLIFFITHFPTPHLAQRAALGGSTRLLALRGKVNSRSHRSSSALAYPSTSLARDMVPRLSWPLDLSREDARCAATFKERHLAAFTAVERLDGGYTPAAAR
jgi:hypothetical protein